jgi:hypothetical protein
VDPFKHNNVKTGFGTMSETILIEPFFKNLYLFSDGFVIVLNPDAVLANTTGSTGLINNWYTYSDYAATTGTVRNASVPANYTQCVAQINTNRIVAAALKVKVSCAQTGVPGDIGYIRFNGLTNVSVLDVLSTNPAALLALPGAETFTTVGSSANVQVNWLPSDPMDFTFTNNTLTDNGKGIFNPIVVFGTGFPSNSKLYVDAVTYVEGQAGKLNAAATINPEGSDVQTEDSLSDSFPSVESMWKSVKGTIGYASENIAYSLGAARDVADLITDFRSGKRLERRTQRRLPPSGMLLIEEMKE